MPDLSNTIVIAVISMGMIFFVLSLFIGIAQLLVIVIPHHALPATETERKRPPKREVVSVIAAEHLEAIQIALARHTGKQPGEFQILSVAPLTKN